jgi:hypothetical protein
MEWQPISTAPKDGTRVLLWMVFEGDETTEPFEDWSFGEWDDGCEDEFFGRPAGWCAYIIGEPTHWLPVTPPPERS